LTRPALVVSVARSGDSPESGGTVEQLLEYDCKIRHLVLTCNRQGRLAVLSRQNSAVRTVTLDDATNDRSLVMTSSFTNLLLATRSLGLVENPERYSEICHRLAEIARELLRNQIGPLANAAVSKFQRAVFLGSGPRLGAARESALKMLEMTAGSVASLCDSYLAFRHGPMTFTHPDTLLVCFLSSDPVLRAYESDVLKEMDEKKLGLMKVIVGDGVPGDLARENDLIIECPGLKDVGDDNSPVIHVIVGQLLAFFRCLQQGLHPDAPSTDGIINRVVRSFSLHIQKHRT
jgi:tagatose-6-phosphate ketose/aldose isomerase